MPKRRKQSISLIVLALVLAGVALIYQQCFRKPEEPPFVTGSRLQVLALDVGQGDSLLITSPGGKNVLIDAGTPQSGDEVVAALRKYGVSSLDLVVATHPHSDHIGGIRRVLDNFPIRNFLDSGQDYPSATYERLLKAIREKGINYIVAKKGQNFELDPGIRLEVLNPMGDGRWITEVRSGGSIQNANSVVLRLSYGNFAMIFTGDAEAETEAEIMKADKNLSAQVLKVGHHGSRYATSNDFLSAVQPQAAIISCGTDNKYGHPSQETLNRLRRHQVQVYRTDLHGEIAIVSDGSSFQVQPGRQVEIAQVWQGRVASRSE
jgi:beta-lactamase superfamily II metal-dependent hydrolase